MLEIDFSGRGKAARGADFFNALLGGRTRPPLMAMNEMLRVGVFDAADANEIDELRRLRNDVVHGMVDYKSAVNRKEINRLERITAKYQDVLDSTPPPADT